MSRWTTEPPSPSPIGTRSRSRAGRGRHAAPGSNGAYVAEREQLHEVGGTGELAGARLDHAGRDRVQRRQPAGERLRGRGAALVGAGPDRLLAQPQRVHRVAAVGGRLAAELDAQPGRVLELVPPRGQVEQGHAVQAVGRYDVVAGRQLAAVDHQQQVRGGGPLVGAEPGPLAEVGRQQRGQVGQRGGHHPHRADRVGLLRALGVRQPLHPVPVGEVLLRARAPRRRAGRGSGTWWPSRSAPGPASGTAPRGRTPRSGRTRAGRSTRAGPAGAGARRAAGAGRTRPPGRPGRWGCSPAAPARARAAARTGRTGRAGSSGRSCRAPTPGTARRPARAARPGRGGARSAPGAAGRRPRERPCGRWRGSGGTRCASRSPAGRAASAAGPAGR